MTKLTPTPQQAAIISAILAGENVMVRALAGCAKTSTIVMAANAIAPSKPAIALAFNKKIADDLKTRLPPNVEAVTMNGLGHRAWGKNLGKKILLEQNKQYKLLDKVLTDLKLTLTYKEKPIIVSLCNALRNIGAIPPGFPTGTPLIPWAEALESSWDFIEEPEHRNEDNNRIVTALLLASIHQGFAGTIDFPDQLYLPVVFGAPWPNPEILFVDEAQDLSPINHIMVKNCRAKQLIVVGDPNQAIYAFRGALSDSMDRFSTMRDFTNLELTVTFRCGKEIVKRAQSLVPDFTAAPNNSFGEVINLDRWDFNTVIDRSIPTAILCRNNAPLIRMALRLLRARIPATILGKDIAKGLVKDIQKASPTNTPLPACLAAVKSYYDNRVELKPTLANILADRFAAIRAAGEGATDRDSLCGLIDSLFSEDPSAIVTLATGHKAKGLEWEKVIHLDSFLIPHKGAKSPEEIQQEYNLRYVIETRAKNTLILASTKGLNSESDDHDADNSGV